MGSSIADQNCKFGVNSTPLQVDSYTFIPPWHLDLVAALA